MAKSAKTFWDQEAAYSSKNSKWETPSSMVVALATCFDWDLDVCASRGNVCERFYTEEDNSLTQAWEGLCWMNPPYGRGVDMWMQKAARSSGTVVCLVPARTDTRWWHNCIRKASLVIFIKGRLQYGDCGMNAPFPSAFIVFGGLTKRQGVLLSSYGWAVRSVGDSH